MPKEFGLPVVYGALHVAHLDFKDWNHHHIYSLVLLFHRTIAVTVQEQQCILQSKVLQVIQGSVNTVVVNVHVGYLLVPIVKPVKSRTMTRMAKILV